MSHRFKLGQKVRFTRAFASREAASGDYEVLARLPTEDGEHQYRIRNIREPYARVVKEGDLERV